MIRRKECDHDGPRSASLAFEALSDLHEQEVIPEPGAQPHERDAGRGTLQFSSTVGVTVLCHIVRENGFAIVVLLFWSQTPPTLSPGPLPEGSAVDPQ
jgi:hypothetical protein